MTWNLGQIVAQGWGSDAQTPCRSRLGRPNVSRSAFSLIGSAA